MAHAAAVLHSPVKSSRWQRYGASMQKLPEKAQPRARMARSNAVSRLTTQPNWSGPILGFHQCDAMRLDAWDCAVHIQQAALMRSPAATLWCCGLDGYRTMFKVDRSPDPTDHRRITSCDHSGGSRPRAASTIRCMTRRMQLVGRVYGSMEGRFMLRKRERTPCGPPALLASSWRCGDDDVIDRILSDLN